MHPRFFCCRGLAGLPSHSRATWQVDAAKQELHTLLAKDQLAGIPVLVLGNKNDLPNAMGVEQLIEALYDVAGLFFFFFPTCLFYLSLTGTSKHWPTAKCAATASAAKAKSISVRGGLLIHLFLFKQTNKKTKQKNQTQPTIIHKCLSPKQQPTTQLRS